MEITFQSEGVDHPQIDEAKTAKWIESVAKLYNKEEIGRAHV